MHTTYSNILYFHKFVFHAYNILKYFMKLCFPWYLFFKLLCITNMKKLTRDGRSRDGEEQWVSWDWQSVFFFSRNKRV